MTNAKYTRKALLSSVVALLLCFSMLMGTTFAWFSDSVTSANNIIQSGKLDVTMEYSDSVTTPNWQDASGTAIFDYEFWEPGYVEVKYIKIANAGNLAFRYELSVIPETLPVAGEVNLADVIDVYFYEFPADATPADITKDQLTDALKVGTLTDMMAESDGAAHGVILPLNGSTNVTLKAEDEAIAREGETVAVIALKMQETAGNEYQGKDVGGTFAVQLLATQYTYENDSFDNLFDNDATYPAVDTVTVPENNTEDVVLSTETVKVVVPSAAAQAGDDYKIEVSNETTETDATTGETTVAFDLTMYKNDAKVSGTTVYAITKSVGTGLFISEVTHNGTALNKDITGAGGVDQTWTYDAVTGELTIYTASFSPFEVTYNTFKDYVRKLNRAHTQTSYISQTTGADLLPIVAVMPEITGYSVFDGDTRITDAVCFRISDVKKEAIDENSYKVSVNLAIKDDKGNDLELKPGMPSTINGKEYLNVFLNLIELPEGYSIAEVRVNGESFTLTQNTSGNPLTGEYWIGSDGNDVYLQSMEAGLIEVIVTKTN